MDAPHSSPLRDTPFDGDPSWSVTRALRDGTSFVIRPISPDDRDELHRAFRATSAETRYLRFMGAVVDLSEETLAYLTNVDQKDHVALVATITSPDLKTERGIGVARLIRLPSLPDVAEAAITVVDDMQRRGAGIALARELERAALLRGIRIFRADVLVDNAVMRAILEGAGARQVSSPDAAGTLSYELTLERSPSRAERSASPTPSGDETETDEKKT